MYYKLNENGEIKTICHFESDGFLYTDEELVPSYDGEVFLFKHQTEDPQYKKSAEEYVTKKSKEKLRTQRENECFPVVNRGELWYKCLTDAQKVELDAWYRAWLNVTQTLSPPVKPSWLN